MFQELPEDNKNEDFLNEFRQKIADHSGINLEEKRNEINRSKSVFIGAVSGLVLAGIVGWFVLSPRYASDNNAEIPVIRRPQAAIKVQPAEPGGMEILNQDKTVYDIMEKKSSDETAVVEKLLPPPEAPKLPEVKASEEVKAAVTAETTAAPEPAVIQETVKETVVVKEVTPPAPAVKEEAPVKEVPLKEAMEQETKAPAPTENPKAIIKAIDVKINEVPAGSWQVQLMSSTNKPAVESSWKNLVKKYSVLAGQVHEIETANLGEKGTFYRLKAGAFRDRAEADRLCNDIKALGGTCIVKKK